MKRLLVYMMALISILLVGCGTRIEPLEVNYTIITKEQYKKDLYASQIKSNFTDTQLQDILYLLGSEHSACMFNTVIVFDKSREELDLSQLAVSYSGVDVLTVEDLDVGRLLTLDSNSLNEDIVRELSEYTAVTIKGCSRVIPVTEELISLSKTAVYKWEFVNTLKEIILGG